MMKKNIVSSFRSFLCSVLLSTVCLTSLLSATTIVFDAGGVLVQSKRGELVKKMLGKFVRYMLFSWKNPAHVKDLTFKVLENLYGKQVPEVGCACACGDGLVLPAAMCDWMSGVSTGKEIIEKTCALIDDGACDKMLGDKREKELVKNILELIFDPEVHANCTHPIPEGVRLLEECAQNENNTLMLLSNYAADAFEKIYNKQEMQDSIFKFIKPEYAVVSGFIGLIKPYASIFQHLLSRYNLNPADVIFIDDQAENIEAAQKLGFKALHLQHGNYDAVRTELRTFGVI